MKKLFVIFSCLVCAIAFMGCNEPVKEPIKERTIIGTLDSVPYYADDYSPHLKYEFADWFYHWAPTVKAEDGVEYIIKRNMFKEGGMHFAPVDSSDFFYEVSLICNPIYIIADEWIYEGDTLMVTGPVYKHHYGGRPGYKIGGGDYNWIEGNYMAVKLYRHSERYYNFIKPTLDSVRQAYMEELERKFREETTIED
ncbi:MAG: hypothetical protein IKO63_00585 [Paludibacteraceae bacterium]|nr:hypothetical protein [Paludibacteraceae bacterium]